MAYALTGDVIKYVGRGDKLLSTASPTTVAQVEDIIDDISAEIDGLITQLDVTLPVLEADSPKAFAILRNLNALGAAARLELRLFGEASPGAARNARFDALLEEYHRLFNMLRDGEVLLIDAEGTVLNDADLASSGSYKDTDGNVIDPFFTRQQNF